MIANGFCGAFLFDGTVSEDSWNDLRARNKEAAHRLAPAPSHKVEVHETRELLLAACTFDARTTPLRCMPEKVGIVAGNPIWCSSGGPPADPESAAGSLIETLLAGHSDGPQAARGSFAAVAFDLANRRLVLSTDKLGIRPVYFCVAKTHIIFATSLAATIRLIGRRPLWDEQGLAETLYFGQSFRDRTPYADLRCLPHGESLVCGAGGKIERRCYFDLAAAAGAAAREGDLESQVQEAFATSVARRSRETNEYSFLSGGLDSRAVVDALIDLGRQVQSFGSSYENSIDDIVSIEAARRLGCRHFRHLRTPSDRLQYGTDQYPLYARKNFPVMSRPGPKAMWSGDGGSVTLGHVYMTADRVERAGSKVSPEMIRSIFPMLARERLSRNIPSTTARRLRDLAEQGVTEEMRRLEQARPDRRLFLFYMNTDQARHLHSHFEFLPLSEIELHTPFFDSDFAATIASMPTSPFLRHALYNSWMERFHPRAAGFYWQEYPGHAPSPHPRPAGAVYQWDQAWFSGEATRATLIDIANRVLRDREVATGGLVNPWLLRLTKVLNRLGQHRLNYEIDFAKRIYDLYHPAPKP